LPAGSAGAGFPPASGEHWNIGYLRRQWKFHLDTPAPGEYFNRKMTMGSLVKEIGKTKVCEPPAEETGVNGIYEDLESDEELAALAKAIAHPVRVRILRMLAGEKTYVCGNIAKNIPLAQSTISQHLKVLKDAGLIRGTVEGPRICYCLNPERVRRLRVLMAGI
jgi:ArsR family transcriptional regulator